jgi:hypothetical protein
MKSIIIAFALIGTVGTAPAHAATCQDLRAKLDRLEEVLNIEKDWLNADDFGSEQEQRDITTAKHSARLYVQKARVYLAHGCTDPGYITRFADNLEQLDK